MIQFLLGCTVATPTQRELGPSARIALGLFGTHNILADNHSDQGVDNEDCNK